MRAYVDITRLQNDALRMFHVNRWDCAITCAHLEIRILDQNIAKTIRAGAKTDLDGNDRGGTVFIVEGVIDDRLRPGRLILSKFQVGDLEGAAAVVENILIGARVKPPRTIET